MFFFPGSFVWVLERTMLKSSIISIIVVVFLLVGSVNKSGKEWKC